MTGSEVQVVPWTDERTPTEAELERILVREGLSYYRWSNGPGDVYAAHTHSFHKVIYVARGSITFGLPEKARQIALSAGDRLELPAGVAHDAVVGPSGVTCLEAHRR